MYSRRKPRKIRITCITISVELRFGAIAVKNVQRKIEPYVSSIPDAKELIKGLPDMIRICPEHGNEILARGDGLPSHEGGGAPFEKANLEGCCDAAIEGVTELIRLIDRAKKRYKEELAPLLEPHHMGEIVGIDLETGDYFVGEDEIAAADKARAAGNEGVLFFLRIGSPHRLIRLTSNADKWLF